MPKVKKIKFEADKRDIDNLVKRLPDMNWGIQTMFECGEMTVTELHAIADIFAGIKNILDIEECEYPQLYRLKE